MKIRKFLDNVAGPMLLGVGILLGAYIALSYCEDKPMTANQTKATAEAETLEPETEIQAPTEDEPTLISLGEFKITYYCSCKICTGDGDGITASGTVATINRTIGVDPEVIPLGTVVYIGGQPYVTEDTGSGIKGKEIDIYIGDHQAALNEGVDYIEVFIKN